MAATVTPFLMFEGEAEQAMTRYVALFGDAEIESIERYGAEGPGPEGSVYRAVFRIGTQRVMCIDSPAAHPFGFTPATSLLVSCDTAAEVDALFSGLADGGEVLMPLGEYPFSPRYGWVNDRFGVSWQLFLAG